MSRLVLIGVLAAFEVIAYILTIALVRAAHSPLAARGLELPQAFCSGATAMGHSAD